MAGTLVGQCTVSSWTGPRLSLTVACANTFDGSCHCPPCALQGDTFVSRWLVSEAQTDWRMSTFPHTYSSPTCQAQLAVAQEESARLCKNLNAIEQLELIADSWLTAESALPQCSKSKPTLQHVIGNCCMSSGWTV